VKTGRSIRDVVLERRLMDAATLDGILSADAMTRGGIVGAGKAGGAGRAGEAGNK
jgi:aspartate ammonia-lyase